MRQSHSEQRRCEGAGGSQRRAREEEAKESSQRTRRRGDDQQSRASSDRAKKSMRIGRSHIAKTRANVLKTHIKHSALVGRVCGFEGSENRPTLARSNSTMQRATLNLISATCYPGPQDRACANCLVAAHTLSRTSRQKFKHFDRFRVASLIYGATVASVLANGLRLHIVVQSQLSHLCCVAVHGWRGGSGRRGG